MLSSQEWYRTTLDWPLSHGPDQNFAYSTGASSLMSIILNNISGQNPQSFIQKYLYGPLDINQHHWELVGSNVVIGQGISDFPRDIAPLGFGIWLKPTDMAKIGELYRNSGVWQGQRLLDAQWVADSIFPYSNGVTDPDVFGDNETGHGYQWWTTIFEDNKNRRYQSYYANGYGRQYIFVFPEVDMVVVSTARDYNYSGQGIGTLLRNHILPGLENNSDNFLTMDKRLNGSWYWPENSGQGLNLEVLDDKVVAYWYTYEQETGQQRWFVMNGQIIDNKAQLTIRSTSGGGFVISDPPQVIEWGTGELFFENCRSGTFTFSSSIEDTSAEIPLTRLTGGDECVAQAQSTMNKSPTYVH